MADEMTLWQSVCQTDPKHTKKANNGKYQFTAVDPQHQLERATKLWGPYGKAWGLRKCNYTLFDVGDKKTLSLAAMFYCPESEFEIHVDMPYRWNDDAYKKLMTAARSKSLSLLGFNADVYLGQYDDERYVQDMQTKHGDQDELLAKAMSAIKRADSEPSLGVCRKRVDELYDKGSINKTMWNELMQAIDGAAQENGWVLGPGKDTNGEL